MAGIISRSTWGARHGTGWGNRSVGRLTKWLHHSVTTHLSASATLAQEYAQMRAIEGIGASRFGSKGGISYNFVVFPSGRIYEGCPIGRVGSHTQGYNTTGAGICLAGNYQTTKPTAAQIAAVAWLLGEGVRRGWWQQPLLTGGHRDTKSTACPGSAAYAQIRTINSRAIELVSNPGGGGGGSVPRPPVVSQPAPIEEDDMPTAKEVAEETVKLLLNYRNPEDMPRSVYGYIIDAGERAFGSLSVRRGGGEVSALQELADAKTIAIRLEAATTALKAQVAAQATTLANMAKALENVSGGEPFETERLLASITEANERFAAEVEGAVERLLRDNVLQVEISVKEQSDG